MKHRLDQLLVARGLVESRTKAQALIMAGQVLVNDEPVEKAGTLLAPEVNIRIRGEAQKYVSRGGDKLAGALDQFAIDVQDVVAIDVGSSTGGFTDCLLQRGAKQVYAVDVGHNQLSAKLLSDPRVVVMEKTHVKDISADIFSPRPTLATIDVSFIGLRKILPFVFGVLPSSSTIVCLVKPQFELGPEYVEKGGVVPGEKEQLLAVKLVDDFLLEHGWSVLATCPSALRGEKSGNQEYFIHATNPRVG